MRLIQAVIVCFFGCSMTAAQEVEVDSVRTFGDAIMNETINTPIEAETVAEAEKEIAQAKDLAVAFRVASKQVLNSVVTVLVRTQEFSGTLANLNLLEDDQRYSSVGSGVILREDGLIVTNRHVVKGGIEIRVRLADGREFVGRELREDASSDIAIFMIDCPTPLAACQLGDSNELSVGDWVLAVGSPFRLDQTVSAGIISGKGRVLEDLVRGQLLQTDAAINPGNSGGALTNLDGELVGINTAIATGSGVYSGVGFAIPINRVKWIAKELEQNGSVRRAVLGVNVNSIPQKVAESLDRPIFSGAYVYVVRKGSPAEKAGIQARDILVKIGDQNVLRPADVAMIVEQLPIDQPQRIELIRKGERLEVEVELNFSDK